jgi:hypothetical protein
MNNKNEAGGYSIIIMMLFILILSSSCATKRSIIKQPLKEFGEEFLIDKMDGAESKFDFLTARCNISIINNKTKTDLKGQIRIQFDSIIWLSMTPALGIEIARLMITTDSIWFINRIEKNYFDGDYDFVTRVLGTSIDFDMLQALVLGNDFSYYENKSFKASVDGNEYKLSTTGRSKLRKYLKQQETPNILVQNLWLNPSNFRISRINLKEFGEENNKLSVEYAKHTMVKGKLIPTLINIDIQGNQRIHLSIELNSVETGVAQTFPFKIPDKYHRIE